MHNKRMGRLFLLIALLTVCFASTAPALAAENRPKPAYLLFNSTEIRSPVISSFTNWTGVLSRFHQAEALGEGLCATAGAGPKGCVWDDWQKIIADLKDSDPMSQLRSVNDIMNAKRYTLDNVNWGADDYWATVFEFMRRSGDCEDYAIAKYVTLRALGWPADKLRLVIVRDTKLDLNHAILAAYTDDGIYIGDNQVEGLVKATSIRHYRPIYSINEDGWWLHRAQPQNRQVSSLR